MNRLLLTAYLIIATPFKWAIGLIVLTLYTAHEVVDDVRRVWRGKP